MPDIDTIADELAAELKKHKADYLEARLEEGQASHIAYRGKELDSIGRSTSVGGNVRALVNGGWGFTSFNTLDGLSDRIAQAVEQAKSAGSGKSNLAQVEPATDNVPTGVDVNPVTIPLAEKKKLLDEYNEIIWSTPQIQTSNIGYSDSRKTVTYYTPSGSHIPPERADVTRRLAAIAANDGEVQQVGLSLGSRGNIAAIQGLQDKVRDMAQNAVNMLTAPQAKGGEYTVVLDPVLAGVFVHEAFGHLSESDFVYENEQMKKIMTLGKQFGGKHLNIVDSAAFPPGLRGPENVPDTGGRAGRQASFAGDRRQDE